MPEISANDSPAEGRTDPTPGRNDAARRESIRNDNPKLSQDADKRKTGWATARHHELSEPVEAETQHGAVHAWPDSATSAVGVAQTGAYEDWLRLDETKSAGHFEEE